MKKHLKRDGTRKRPLVPCIIDAEGENGMDMKRRELLETLKTRLETDDGIGEISLFTAQELNSPVDILRAELTEFGPDLVSRLGEFFFLPSEDEGLMYFTTVVTLSGSVPREAVPDVAAAVARLNYYIPCGCYALGDDDKNLIYRYTALLTDAKEKQMPGEMVVSAALTALSTAEKYLSFLLLVLNNEISVEEMVGMILGRNNPVSRT